MVGSEPFASLGDELPAGRRTSVIPFAFFGAWCVKLKQKVVVLFVSESVSFANTLCWFLGGGS